MMNEWIIDCFELQSFSRQIAHNKENLKVLNCAYIFVILYVFFVIVQLMEKYTIRADNK